MHSCSCGATWGGRQACHCAGCHRSFTGESSFVRHRRDLQCVDPATARRKDGSPAFELNARGQWATAQTEKQKDRMRALIDGRPRNAPRKVPVKGQDARTGQEVPQEGSGPTGASNPGCAGAA